MMAQGSTTKNGSTKKHASAKPKQSFSNDSGIDSEVNDSELNDRESVSVTNNNSDDHSVSQNLMISNGSVVDEKSTSESPEVGDPETNGASLSSSFTSSSKRKKWTKEKDAENEDSSPGETILVNGHFSPDSENKSANCNTVIHLTMVSGSSTETLSSPEEKQNIDLAEKDTKSSLSVYVTDRISGRMQEKEVEVFQEKEKSFDETKDDDSRDQEVVFIQDAGFSIKIAAPGLEPFEIQVSAVELVQEIHQLLMDREDTCHRTCFSLQLDNNILDNFVELKNIEGLQEGSVIKVVEEPYTMREARIHVRHVRDLLKSLDLADAYNGIDCSSLSFVNIVTQGDILEKKKTRPDSVDCTPPDYIMPSSKERPLLPLHPQAKEQKGPQCLKILTTSGWNPPPGIRKLRGDLLYLYVVTLEDKRFHITASTRGFFVNMSTEEEFNPKPATPNYLCHSLIDLLNQISSGFKRNFSFLQKKRTQRHPFERVATPYQVYQWITPNLDHTVDAIRAEDAFSSKLGYEEHIPGQIRDWNEELQSTRELPRKNLPERLLRERAIFKVHSDFVAAATRGAMAVIDGNVMAINPGEEANLGFDVRDHYKELGGDAAAYVAPRNDLQGVKVYSNVDLEGLYTLGTVVIDYRGYRITAQSIIPGILEREQDQSVVYGSVDFGKTVVTHPKYLELLNMTGQQLKILPHTVINERDEEIELCSSVECKGIIGNDSRHYILDLLRTFPPDVNFLKLEGEELSKESQSLGFPIEHKHKLSCLRQELIDAFVEARYVMFIKFAAYQLQQLGLKKQQKDALEKEKEFKDTKEFTVAVKDKILPNDDFKEGNFENECKADVMETDEAKKIFESITEGEKCELEENTKEIVRKAALAVGSLKESEFDIRFNPDVYSPGVKHPNQQGERLKKERQLVKEAAEFLLNTQIPGFIRDCLDHSITPIDGSSLSEALHNRGINIRYLGKIADMLAKIPQLEYVYIIAIMELVSRSTKHIFTVYLQGVEMMSLAAAISHFLNCFLSSCLTPHASIAADELQSRNSKKKNKRKNKPGYSQDNNEWACLTPKSLWINLKSELKAYYDWSLEADSIDLLVEKYSVQKIPLLRSFSLKLGLQIALREYNMDHKHRQAFNEDDVINIFPVVKHINPRATDALNFYTLGQSKIQQGSIRDGLGLITEALNLLNSVYGALHPEIAQCLRMLARLQYILGDHTEAMVHQQKAVLMSERVNGIDHPHTITEYTHLAMYCFANSQVSTALKLLYRSRYLMLLVFGENHPEVALLDSNIGLILHAVGEYDLSLRFLEKALQLNIKFYGAKSLKVAVSYHLVARTQSCMGNFRGALQNEKETFAIYKQQLGEDHEKTKESSDCLKHLTQQAVAFQKKMNEIYNGKTIGNLPPIQIQPPSMGSVLDMLNMINGIVFVQISPQDIENYKVEMERRQQKESSSEPSSPSLGSLIKDGEPLKLEKKTENVGEGRLII